MVRIASTVSAGLAALLYAGSTRAASPAADLATGGTSIVSAEQLAPILSYDSTTESENGTNTTDSSTTFGLVTSIFRLSGVQETFHTLPRLAFDYVLGPGVTIGGSAFVFTDISASTATSPSGGGTSTTTQEPKGTLWGVAPRVGFVLPAGGTVAIWPRLGVGYADYSIGSTTNNGVTVTGGSINQLSLDVDGLLVWTPVHHFGITIGPTGNIPLSGKVSSQTTTVTAPPAGTTTTTTVSNDVKMWHVGLNVGLLGYF